MNQVDEAKTVEKLRDFLDTKMVYNNEFLNPWYNPYGDKRKDLSFNWNEVPGKDTTKFIKFLKKKLNIDNYLFRWNEISGKDNDKLRKFLKRKYGIRWVRKAQIKKIDDGNIISLHFKNNFLSLKLNDEKTKVSLIIDDNTLDEFISRTEKDNLIIYNDWIQKEEIDKTDRIIKICSEKNNISLILNESKTKASLKIDSMIIDYMTIDEFIVKLEEGNLNVYTNPKLYLYKTSALNNAIKYFMSRVSGKGRRQRELGDEWGNISNSK